MTIGGPEAGKDESDPGTNFVGPCGAAPKGDIDLGYITKAKWFLELVDGSREPGVCVNWPSKESAKTTPDLQFMETDDIQITDGEGIKAEVQEEYGSHARGHAVVRLGRVCKAAYPGRARGWAEAGGVCRGRAWQDHAGFIPKDEDDNRIADSWQDDHEVPRGIKPKFEYAFWPEDTRFCQRRWHIPL